MTVTLWLAVSMLFGVGASPLLTLIVIPLLYYHLIGKRINHTRCSNGLALGDGEFSERELVPSPR